ncbi:MAG: YCF48-related protein, partial [candidate division WOR-3 bacterium]
MKQLVLFPLVLIVVPVTGQVYHGVAVAPNGLDAWVIDNESVAIYHTPDFGESWEPQDIPTTRRLFGLFFLDEQRGWTCGDVGAIHATTDGGASWFRQNLGGPKFSSRIQFLDATYGWSSGGTAMLLVTDDGGSTWRLDYFPNPPFVPETVDFQGLSFVDRTTGWLAAGRYPELDTLGNPTLFRRGQGYIAKVTASGDTFIHELQHKDTVYDFYDVHFTDAQYGWVVGGEDSTMAAVVYHTTDGGDDWARQNVPTQARFLRAVDFVDRNRGWACGRNGTIIRTTDGGGPPRPRPPSRQLRLSRAPRLSRSSQGQITEVGRPGGRRAEQSRGEPLFHDQPLDQQRGAVAGPQRFTD